MAIQRLNGGLFGIGLTIAVVSMCLAAAAWWVTPRLAPDAAATRNAIVAAIALTSAAVLIGFVPMRLLLAAGHQHIVTAWLAAMLVRMVMCLAGLMVLIKGLSLSPVYSALTVCGHYMLLLGLETAMMNRLLSRLAAHKN